MKIHLVISYFLLITLVGCSAKPSLEYPAPAASSSPEINPAPTDPTAPPATQSGVTTPGGQTTIRIWLPNEFDPESGTPAGKLLKARLEEFTSRKPNTRIEVRIKSLDGPGGILDALTTASAAAPLSLPDLVALPRPILEVAAVKGLLRPLDALIEPVDDSDWYEYALQIAHLQDSTYGLPFAGDALILVHRVSTIPDPPGTLSETLQTTGPLVFPAADPQALFTIAQYEASGGKILDEQGRPSLQAAPLTRVLNYYRNAASIELVPNWLTQYQNDEQSWEAYVDGIASMVVTWTSSYLLNQLADAAGTQVPTPDGKPFTLATGWVWALASPNPERQKLTAELAEYLTEGEFLAAWTTAAGYLPTRSSAMTSWGTPEQRQLAGQVVSAARLVPAVDVLNSLGPPLSDAAISVLKQLKDPDTAARDAVELLSNP